MGFEGIKEFLSKVYFGNSLQDYLIAILIFLLIVFLMIVVEKIILNRIRVIIKNSGEDSLVVFVDIFNKRVSPIIKTVSVYVASNYLTISDKVDLYITRGVTLIVSVFVVLFVTDAVRNILGVRGIKENKLPSGVITIIQVVIWILAFLFILSNFGFNVTTFVAGLGIGGVAIALASQSILGDLFNYFVILFDKPFSVGDYVQVDDKMGVVEYIGIKSTRICSVTGEQILISNTDLTKSRIHNYKVMRKRRAFAKLCVTYNTDISVLRRIPDMLKEIVEANTMCELSRVHFSEFGAYSLNFDLVFFVDSNDMVDYAKVVQEINFAIADRFAEEKITFAFPTNTVYLEK